MLSALNVRSGTGPDGITSSFLKACKSALIKPLFYLYNLSLSTGIFPDIWKKSFVTPISGDKSDVRNYRPISKLSVIPKLFEAIITKKLTALLSYDQNCQVDSIYTDFKKAFDKVNHNILLSKLKAFGFNGLFLKWITSYLNQLNFHSMSLMIFKYHQVFLKMMLNYFARFNQYQT
ncbi:uncharacterized protein LOC111041765 [Myzus persicae]|uniref:uncharacterized protein LOC111041765 n=1 Tax=Myzus persicae TaxID=13164 RepID=UPI000B933843|nr:uncharacterized protein LOC111041765 [Myzus persicae]